MDLFWKLKVYELYWQILESVFPQTRMSCLITTQASESDINFSVFHPCTICFSQVLPNVSFLTKGAGSHCIYLSCLSSFLQSEITFILSDI